MSLRASFAVVAGILLSSACAQRVSDTGYVGTWARGNPNARSIVSISKNGDQYRFSWKLTSLDGKWTASCDANAHCVEIFDGKKTTEYQFSTRVDPTTGHLRVEGAQTSYEPNGDVRGKVTDVDEMVVEENGLKLGSYTIERNGEKLAPGTAPQRHFDKISDAVLEPGL